EWTGGQSWRQVGGPADSIIGGSAGLLATTPGAGNVVMFDGGSGWTQIGGPGAQFAEDGYGDVFGLTSGKNAVMEWTGGQSWTQVGGPASSIVVAS
ncbi:hypothetical protein P3T37_006594, partial [Kitasatospora sp. MAA4]|uniref:hypothetical protein n=1 Tax=Kitasatospora sp. MAA4 TaxID=3035093 RepID=UPI0024770D0D